MKKLIALTLALVAFSALTTFADDWPQWRGPNRNDISKETDLLAKWPEAGPSKDWLFRDAGLGYSGFSIADGVLYTMGARDDQEYLIAVDVATGKEKWSKPVGDKLNNRWGDGPRSTPTVDAGLVYSLSATGTLTCAKTTDGSIVWQTKMQDFGGRTPFWGYSESVLIDGDKCVCTPGGRKGAIVALNKTDGKLVWQSTDFKEGAQYSSIIAVDHNDVRQYIQLTMRKLVGLDAKTGDVLWTTDFPGRTAVIPTPIFEDGHVFVTSGYGAGCKLIKLAKGHKVEEVYSNRSMSNHHGGVLLFDGHIYGYSDRGGWTCMKFLTGEVVWSERRALGKGSLTYADGKLYCLDRSTGVVALIDATPQGWNLRSKFELTPQTRLRKPAGKIWTHPVIANGKLYLRDQELLFQFDVNAKK